MTSALTPQHLYSVSAALFLFSVPSHALLGRSLIVPGLAPCKNNDAAVAATNNWMVQSLYHLVSVINIHRWSQMEASEWTVHDNGILAVLVMMNWVSAAGFRRPTLRRIMAMVLTRSTILAVARAWQLLATLEV